MHAGQPKYSLLSASIFVGIIFLAGMHFGFIDVGSPTTKEKTDVRNIRGEEIKESPINSAQFESKDNRNDSQKNTQQNQLRKIETANANNPSQFSDQNRNRAKGQTEEFIDSYREEEIRDQFYNYISDNAVSEMDFQSANCAGNKCDLTVVATDFNYDLESPQNISKTLKVLRYAVPNYESFTYKRSKTRKNYLTVSYTFSNNHQQNTKEGIQK